MTVLPVNYKSCADCGAEFEVDEAETWCEKLCAACVVICKRERELVEEWEREQGLLS